MKAGGFLHDIFMSSLSKFIGKFVAHNDTVAQKPQKSDVMSLLIETKNKFSIL